jgi:threonine dehydrogenase-like Zn-dependent dehydrogenase
MKQALLYGDYDLRVESVDAPVAGDGQVLIDVGYCGICGSE